MKKIPCFTLCLLALTRISLAQIDTVWTTTAGLGSALNLVDGVYVPGIGFDVVGTTASDETVPDVNIGIIRVDDNGSVSAMQLYGGFGAQEARATARFADGTLLVLASDAQQPNPATNLFVMGVGDNGDSLWSVYLPQVYSYHANDAVTAADGNVIVTAEIQGVSDAERDIWIAKFDSAGDTLWSRVHNLQYEDYPCALAVDDDGFIYLAGYARGETGPLTSLFFMTMTPDGAVAATQYLHNDEGYHVGDLKQTADGDFFIVGAVIHFVEMTSLFVAKVDQDGEVLFYNDQYETNVDAYFEAVAPREDGGAECVGRLTHPMGVSPLTLTVDLNGNEIGRWHATDFNGTLSATIAGGAGDYLACGTVWLTGEPHVGLLAMFAPSTTLTGTVTELDTGAPLAGVTVSLEATSVSDLTDDLGRYELRTRSSRVDVRLSGPCVEGELHPDVELIQGEINSLDFALGVPLYEQEPSSVNATLHYDVTDTSYVTLSNPGSGSFDFFIDALPASPAYEWLAVEPASGSLAPDASLVLAILMRPDSEQGSELEFFGSLIVHSHTCPDSLHTIPVSAVALDADVSPVEVAAFRLLPAYPNPFNAETSIRFELPRAGDVRVELFDIHGRLAATLLHDFYPAGAHALHLNLTDSPSGVYFLRFDAVNHLAVQKLVLLK